MPVPRPIPGQVITGAKVLNSRVDDAQLNSPTLASPIISGDLAHTGSKAGFFNTAAVTQPTALTAEHAAISQAGTDTGDVAIQAATSSSPFGFVNAAEFEAVLATIINLHTRVGELETKLQALGLLA